MSHGLKFTPKPNEFCVTLISWEADGQVPIVIAEVYYGPEEHGSSGPFFDCNYRWELYNKYGGYELFLWRYKVRSGYNTEDYESFEIYQSNDYGKTWEKVFSRCPGSMIDQTKK